MKRFLTKALLYLIPVWVLLAVVYYVDPYYLFKDGSSFNQNKFEIGYSYDQGRRYKIFTYLNKPTSNIIIGASEINLINERNIPQDDWHSLSFGGAPLQESLKMYWKAKEMFPLKKVIIAPEFIKYYNAIASDRDDPYYTCFNWNTSQSAKTLEIYDNKLDYFIDKYTLKTTWKYLLNPILRNTDKSKPKSSKEDFWKVQIDYALHVYNDYTIVPDKITDIKELFCEIKKDADANGIEIMIVIPIQHEDLLKLEFQEGTFNTYEDYILTLLRIFGKVYYLAYTEGISSNYDEFSDPFHCKDSDYYLSTLFSEQADVSYNEERMKERLIQIKGTIFKDE